MNDKQKQIEEMAKITDTAKKPCDCLCVSECIKHHPNCTFRNRNEWSCIGNVRAESIYSAGYRKASDMAREIAEMLKAAKAVVKVHFEAYDELIENIAAEYGVEVDEE